MKNELKKMIPVGIALIVLVIFVLCLLIPNKSVNIKYTDQDRDATVTIGEDDLTNKESEEYGMGSLGEEVEAPEDVKNVEEIDHTGPVVDEEVEKWSVEPSDGEEHGRGAFIYAPTDSWSAFKNYTLGNCYNTDGAYGAQCWDLADMFWQNAAGRRAQTCGTGAAKGMIQAGCWEKNAGNEFEMIWNPTQIKAGDWVVFTNGEWGHVGMAVGSYNNGYVTLLGQNQGGSACPGGGSATNIININLKNFGGAFRFKEYIEPEPAPIPTPTPEPEVNYIVKKGDTLGQIILNEGILPQGKKLFGNEGFAEEIAKKNGISNRGLIYPGQKLVLK